MALPKKPPPAKLVAGLLYGDDATLLKSLFLLEKRFGPVEKKSVAIPFTRTPYYEKEMGIPLIRQFLLFRQSVEPEGLAAIKIEINKLEDSLRNLKGERRVNIDPGILTLHNMVLASAKAYSHRIYLGQGIYGELTYRYGKGEFRPLEWTYPEYAEKEKRLLFGQWRATMLIEEFRGEF